MPFIPHMLTGFCYLSYYLFVYLLIYFAAWRSIQPARRVENAGYTLSGLILCVCVC